jgi:hypothetical protein
MYTATQHYFKQIELAGFDLDTKQMVFYTRFGGPDDGDVPFPERGGADDAILIHGDILYYLSWSVAAWDLNTGNQLYRHIFGWDVPEPLNYSPTPNQIKPVYYKGKIYYTSAASYTTQDSFRNIHCIDATTGELVWNTIAKGSYTLHTNPVIAHNRLYIPQFWGLRVYEPETGKLTGVDKSFRGEEGGRNVLYKDYMICVQRDFNNETLDGRMVAIYVGNKTESGK